MRACLPNRGDVPASRRHRRLRQVDLYRVQGVHCRVPLRRDLHQPGRQVGREVQLLRASARHRSGARVRRGLSDTGDPCRRHARSAVRGESDHSSGGGHGSSSREGDPTQAVLQGRRPGDAGPARGAPSGWRSLHVERAGRSRPSGTVGAPGAVEQLRRGGAQLRHPTPRSVGLPGQPLHIHEVDRGGRVPRSALVGRARHAAVHVGTVGHPGSDGGDGRPDGDRRASRLGPRAPRALLDGALQAAVAQLARARRVRDHGLRRSAGGPSRGNLDGSGGSHTHVRLARGPSRGDDRRLHGVSVCAGEGT